MLNNFKNDNKFSCVPSCCQLLLWYHLYYLHCCVVGTVCLAADPGALRAPQRPLQHNFDYCKLYNWWRPVFTEEITVANHLHHPGTKKLRTELQDFGCNFRAQVIRDHVVQYFGKCPVNWCWVPADACLVTISYPHPLHCLYWRYWRSYHWKDKLSTSTDVHFELNWAN